MKNNYLLLFMSIIALALMTSVLSCKKDEKTSTASVVGYWDGTLGSNISLGLLFRSNGTVRLYEMSQDTSTAIKMDGTYEVSDKSVAMSIGIASLAGIVNDQGTVMTGTAISNESTYSFSVTKQ